MADLTFEERLAALEARTLSLKDLPLAALQRKLETDWRPSGPVLLGESSVTEAMLAAEVTQAKCARVYNDANISLGTSGVGVVLTFNSERYDTGNFHSTSSNTDRLTAPTAGIYRIGGTVQFGANATGFRQVEIVLNGTSTIGHVVCAPVPGGAVTVVHIGTEYQLAAGDYVTLRATQASGGALNVQAGPNYSPEFWIARLGDA